MIIYLSIGEKHNFFAKFYQDYGEIRREGMKEEGEGNGCIFFFLLKGIFRISSRGIYVLKKIIIWINAKRVLVDAIISSLLFKILKLNLSPLFMALTPFPHAKQVIKRRRCIWITKPFVFCMISFFFIIFLKLLLSLII